MQEFSGCGTAQQGHNTLRLLLPDTTQALAAWGPKLHELEGSMGLLVLELLQGDREGEAVVVAAIQVPTLLSGPTEGQMLQRKILNPFAG